MPNKNTTLHCAGYPSEKKQNVYFNEKLDTYRQKLEQKTGFHFGIKTDKKGGGQILLNFSNEAEFNDLYEYLIK